MAKAVLERAGYEVLAAFDKDEIARLVDNALRHTPEGGTITASVEQTQEAVQIRVRDMGAGIAAEQLPYVVDRFYRTDQARSRDRGGAGLGLAIVKANVEAHGGTMQLVLGSLA